MITRITLKSVLISMARSREIAAGCYWVFFSPIGKCISRHPVLKFRPLSENPFGPSCILARIASRLQAVEVFSLYAV